MSNMKIWDAVSKTDPKHTKQVNQRGGFTAVNANSQVMAATKQFGPVGTGWGYEAGAPIFTPDNLIIIPVTLWHGSRDNVFGPEYGAAELVSDKGRRDSDAPKKATTDAITKLLSRLGFNADVFLGLYDDQKYVAAMEREFAEAPPTIDENQQTEIIALCEGLNFPIARVLEVKKIASLEHLPAESFEGAKRWINDEVAKARKEPA